jgi:hypothetical protein
MKNLLLIVLIVAVLITAGCTGEKQNPVVTPTQNPVVSLTQKSVVTPTPQVVYVTVTVLVTPTSMPSQTVIADQGSWQTYKDREFNFAIQIPKSWTAAGEHVTTAGSVKKYKVIFDDPTLTSMQYITITPGSSGLSLEDWANIFLTQMKADSSVGTVDQYPLQVDGTPAKKLVFTTGSGKDALESTIIMTVKGDNSYFMEFTSRKYDYPRYSQDADRMIKTFKFA